MEVEGELPEEATWSRQDRELLVAVGARLREVRRRKGWPLSAIARLTQGEFRASALANYERGYRAISAARLMRLAEFYGTDAADLLRVEVANPPVVDLTRGRNAAIAQRPGPHLVIDVAALEAAEHTPDVEKVWSFVRSLRTQRADAGPLFTLRAGDVISLVRVLGRTPASICADLGGAVVDFAE